MNTATSTRADRQGTLGDDARLQAALASFARDYTRTTATYLEACVHCGQCAQACQYYVTTRDPKYTPIWKLEPFKQHYSREAGPFARVFKALGLKREVTLEALEAWQELLYETCNQCGRCTMICPMGIDIAGLVGLARRGMFEAGLVPQDLYAAAERAHRAMSPIGATPQVLKERIAWLCDEHDVEIPLDRPKADVLVTLSSIEIMKYPQSLVAVARIMAHAGVDWTISQHGYEATNFAMFAGSRAWQRELSERIIGTAIATGAKLVVLPECGHAYGALRWQGANVHGAPLPFRVLHISEYLAELADAGTLKLRRLDRSVTFHDPCQVSRRGGASSAPRTVFAALRAELREMPDHAEAAWCCGGGGGVIAIERTAEQRHRVFRIKMEQVEATGAELLTTSCANCRQAFDAGSAHFQWDKKMQSLLELVADHLDMPSAPAAKP